MWQNKVLLKTGITLFVAAGLCYWVIYGLLNPKITVRYNDFAIDSAVAWLENADRQDSAVSIVVLHSPTRMCNG